MERKKRFKGRGWESCYVKKKLRDVWCRNESVVDSSPATLLGACWLTNTAKQAYCELPVSGWAMWRA